MNREQIRNEIINLWGAVKREGANKIVDFLHISDFFEAPCSTAYHLNYPGGLAEHSLNVYNLLEEKIQRYNLAVSNDTTIICGLGHDLCKCNFYTEGTRNVKENGKWITKKVYVVNDQFPYGHGEKSVSILQDYMLLTKDEKLAIRWHMVAFDPGIHFNYPSGFPFRAAADKCPLVTVLFTADFEASQILEAK